MCSEPKYVCKLLELLSSKLVNQKFRSKIYQNNNNFLKKTLTWAKIIFIYLFPFHKCLLINIWKLWIIKPNLFSLKSILNSVFSRYDSNVLKIDPRRYWIFCRYLIHVTTSGKLQRQNDYDLQASLKRKRLSGPQRHRKKY